MVLERLGEDCVFAFLPELEPAWGAISLLIGEPVNARCIEIYGGQQIAVWKRKYHFLFETFQAMADAPAVCMMDFLLDIPLEGITLERFQDVIAAVPPEEFVWRQLELERLPGANKETLKRALTEDKALDEAFQWVSGRCESFLAFSAFCCQSSRFIAEFFALAMEMDTPALRAALEKQGSGVKRFYQTLLEESERGDWLALSQELMGKVFHNRGPYERFVFIPSYLMPMKACRYFHWEGAHKSQILFLTLEQRSRSVEDRIRTLKAIADPTRYQILTILARDGPLRGLDIAKRVSVAASTVSHHMEQMKESGLITEEPVKNAKYYGLSKQAAKSLLDEIARDLQIES